MREAIVNGCRLTLVAGDITRMAVDAIVNAANAGLRGGGGVDGAIHRAGGPEIMAECRRIGGCPTGEARITTAGQLPAKHVIHTVGPVWRGGSSGEPELLASAYRNSLRLADQHQLASIAFPAVSAGIYGYPIELATHIAIGEVVAHAKGHTSLREVKFVLFSPAALAAYEAALSEIVGRPKLGN